MKLFGLVKTFVPIALGFGSAVIDAFRSKDKRKTPQRDITDRRAEMERLREERDKRMGNE